MAGDCPHLCGLRVSMCCNALQCVAVCCSVVWFDAVFCSVLQCVAISSQCNAMKSANDLFTYLKHVNIYIYISRVAVSSQCNTMKNANNVFTYVWHINTYIYIYTCIYIYKYI